MLRWTKSYLEVKKNWHVPWDAIYTYGGRRDTVSRIRRGTRWTVRWAPWSLYDVYPLHKKLFGP